MIASKKNPKTKAFDVDVDIDMSNPRYNVLNIEDIPVAEFTNRDQALRVFESLAGRSVVGLFELQYIVTKSGGTTIPKGFVKLFKTKDSYSRG